ncbi:hypothetical protein Tco_1101992 [Tanacetum coccineum]
MRRPEYPPSLEFVPEPVYPEFMPPEDEILPAEEQPLPAADSPGYVPKLTYGDDRGWSHLDACEDDDVDIKENEEEEHPAPVDSTAVTLPTVDLALFTLRKMSQFLTTTTSISTVPVLILHHTPTSPICPLGYRAAMIRLRAEAVSTSHSLPLPPPIILSHTKSTVPSSGTPPLLPIPLPTSSPPLHQLSTGRRADRRAFTVTASQREIMQDLERDVGVVRDDREFYTRVRKTIRDLYKAHGAKVTEFESSLMDQLRSCSSQMHKEAGRQFLGSSYGTYFCTTLLKYYGNSRPITWPPKDATRSNIAPKLTNNTTSVTNAQLQAMINQGITAALAARDADRNTNGGMIFALATLQFCCFLNGGNTISQDSRDMMSFSMPWKTLIEMMTDKYYSSKLNQKLQELEVWDLKGEGYVIDKLYQRFLELDLSM